MTTVDHDMLIATLDRLKLTAIRDQLDTLLDEAARSKMNLREALGFLVSREIARRDERRISMSSKLAQFPFVRELDGVGVGMPCPVEVYGADQVPHAERIADALRRGFV